MKQPASIFNDVIGPIMRGPSSSHTAASFRIGKLAGQTIKGKLRAVNVDFDPRGSLATTYHGHGSDTGLVGGLLNMDLTGTELTEALKIAANKGIKVSFNVVDYPAEHPNTYRITLTSEDDEEVRLTAISVGGGMIELVNIEGLPVSISGGFYETLVFLHDADEALMDAYQAMIGNTVHDMDCCDSAMSGGKGLIDIKTGYEIPGSGVTKLRALGHATRVMQLSPVLPIMSKKDCGVPFTTAEGLLELAESKNLQIWELAALYESMRGNIPTDEVFARMKSIVGLMKSAVDQGLKRSSYRDRILGPQAWMLNRSEDERRLIGGKTINTVIAYITSIMEVKSSMGVIVAAPTAGSCGGLPGTLIAVAEVLGLNDDDVTKGLLTAGVIGVFIAEHATFAAEVGGCQAECGSGSGMAAAGLVQLMRGTARQAVDAASMALQNIFGLVCDPVAERVEVPCLGKNVMGGLNAIAAANMAMAGFDKVIPLDETIEAMDKVGRMLPSDLRCNGRGGLSKTATAEKIRRTLESS